MQTKTTGGHTYIIAEAGQNHNGSFDLAKNLIDIAAVKVGHQGHIFQADAIKFCKRDMQEELTVDEYNRPYLGSHSYGKTYGAHREALELSYEEHAELFLYAKKKGLDFIETVCNPGALKLLRWFRPDFIKVASRDINNVLLLEAIREADIPIILSTGMSGIQEVQQAVWDILPYQSDVTIMHCVSQYPALYENLNLRSVSYLRNYFFPENLIVGYSDHTTGVLAASIAVMEGAQVIEKHITYDRGAKGTDHTGSMDLGGFERVIRDIRNTELAKGEFVKHKPTGIDQTEHKLRRSVCLRKDMKKGEIISKADLVLLSPGTGIPPEEIQNIIGCMLLCDVKGRTSLEWIDLVYKPALELIDETREVIKKFSWEGDKK
jgi:sialic acid synthase